MSRPGRESVRDIIGDELLVQLAREYQTPLYVYLADTILEQIEQLRPFDVITYAQKANANLSILRLMRHQGVRVDAVSAGEVRRALLAGYSEEEIVFTADLFDRPILHLLGSIRLPVNLGSMDMIAQYGQLQAGKTITLRVNPGFGHGHHRKVSTGGEASKHGIWHEQLQAALAAAARNDLQVIGLHMHIGSGSDFQHLARVREALSAAVLAVGPAVTGFSVGGGLPVPYQPDDEPFDAARFCAVWQATRSQLEKDLGHKLVMSVEPGRYLIAQAGLLLAEVRATKTNGALRYILVDAGMDNLLRPALYGAYHAISVLGGGHGTAIPQVVAGPLCESADVLTQGEGGLVETRLLPEVAVGDHLCIHDVGAYGASMASGYNSRLLAAEVLIQGGKPHLIRRRQSFEQLMAPEVDLVPADDRDQSAL